jgi:cell filamentation protein
MSNSYWNDNSDVYQYQNSTVLKNIPGIKDEVELAAFEKLAVAKRLEDVYLFVEHELINLILWQNIHRIMFQDIFTWAGQLRSVQMSKGATVFAFPEHIESEAMRLFSAFSAENNLNGLNKQQFCNRMAYYFSELNVLHPFRDGNGRAQRLLFEIISTRANYEISWWKTTPKIYIDAVIAGYHQNFSPLDKVFQNIVTEAFV